MSERSERLDAENLVLLANDAMRARRRPFAIGALWAWQSLLAFVVAWPAAELVSSAYGAHPQGDGPLWNPGALELLQLYDHATQARALVIGLLMVIGTVAAVGGLVPLGALIASMGYATRAKKAPRAHSAMGAGIRAFLPMLLLLFAATVLEAIVAGVGVFFGDWVRGALLRGMGDARAMQLGWLATGLFLVPVAMIGVAHDLARAAAVRFRAGFVASTKVAWRTFRAAFFSLFWSWLWRAFAACVPVAIGAFVADRLGGRAGGALVALALVHQLVVLSRLAFRASWLARALRAVDAVAGSGQVAPAHPAASQPAASER